MSDIDLPLETMLPPLEDTVDLRPSIPFLLPKIVQTFILPYLPALVQPYKPWPGQIFSRPIDAPWDSSLLDVILDLLAIRKVHGATVTPVVEVAYLAAVWSVHCHTPTLFRNNTLKSERSTAHPYCTGNYASSLDQDRWLGPDDDFWALVKATPKIIGSNLRRARMNMGTLAYVPDGVLGLPNRPTKWEEFFLAQAESDTPYPLSVTISNLGHAPLLEATDIVWGSNKPPFGPVYDVCMIGHNEGIRLMTMWREGAGTTREEVKQVETVFIRILERLGTGHTILGDLCRVGP